jgi:hypothetical protein
VLGKAFGDAGIHSTATISQMLLKGGDPRMSTQPHQPDTDAAVRDRVLERAKAINTKLLARLETVAEGSYH